jgi:hypothetical protein
MKLVNVASKVTLLTGLPIAGCNLHDIHTILHLMAHWPLLEEHTQQFAAHQLCLQYMATTKDLAAAINNRYNRVTM